MGLRSIFVWVAALCLAGTGLHGLRATLAHDSGNANASKSISSASLHLEEHNTMWGYQVFARRDAIPNDRTLSNALAIVYGNVDSGNHRFSFGLGSHVRILDQAQQAVAAPDFLPALGFAWAHPNFHFEVSASEKLTRSAISILFKAIIPIELGSQFEYIDSQPYRWSANSYTYISRYGGVIVGYEPISARSRLGVWLKPATGLQLRALTRLRSGSDPFLEFAVTYSLQNFSREPAQTTVKITTPVESRPKKQAYKKQTPAFATLVKWGLSPVEALQYTRGKELCDLSAPAQVALQKHHWECQRAN